MSKGAKRRGDGGGPGGFSQKDVTAFGREFDAAGPCRGEEGSRGRQLTTVSEGFLRGTRNGHMSGLWKKGGLAIPERRKPPSVSEANVGLERKGGQKSSGERGWKEKRKTVGLLTNRHYGTDTLKKNHKRQYPSPNILRARTAAKRKGRITVLGGTVNTGRWGHGRPDCTDRGIPKIVKKN